MDIGIPKETRLREHRVALTPSGVRTLVQKGHRVWVE
jgi:alanine dehydrogenase